LSLLAQFAESNQVGLEQISANILNTPLNDKDAEILALEQNGTAQRTAAQILSGAVPHQFMESILNSVIVNQPKETLTLVVSLIVELRKIKETQKGTLEEALKYLEKMIEPLTVKLWKAKITIAEYKWLLAELDEQPDRSLEGQAKRYKIIQQVKELLSALGLEATTDQQKWENFITELERQTAHLEVAMEKTGYLPELLDIVNRQTADRINILLNENGSFGFDNIRRIITTDLNEQMEKAVCESLKDKLAGLSAADLHELADAAAGAKNPIIAAFIENLAKEKKEEEEAQQQLIPAGAA
jgi:hypothetical protein